jgi:redox-sensitive bicupin YhaK (pirin superfamily)
MPEQQEGLLKGFQLWVNLPRSVKMSEPAYQEFPADKVAEERHSDGTYIRVIAGKTGQGTVGPVVNDHTFPTYMDITIPAGVTFEQPIDSAHNAFVYVIEGALAVGEQAKVVGAKTLGVFHQGNGEGDQISVTAQSETRFMLAAGKPLNEPVARGGPFVMNTREEINQAFDDFRRGQF